MASVTGASERFVSNFCDDHLWPSVAGWKKLWRDLDVALLGEDPGFVGEGEEEGSRVDGAEPRRVLVDLGRDEDGTDLESDTDSERSL